MGESCAVLVRCLVEALRVVRETLLERWFGATNVLLNCIITGLDCDFVDDSFLLTLSIEGQLLLSLQLHIFDAVSWFDFKMDLLWLEITDFMFAEQL